MVVSNDGNDNSRSATGNKVDDDGNGGNIAMGDGTMGYDDHNYGNR